MAPYIGRKSSPPGGRLSVALTRHWDTYSSNPGVYGRDIFSFLWPFSVTPYCLLGQLLFLDLHAVPVW